MTATVPSVYTEGMARRWGLLAAAIAIALQAGCTKRISYAVINRPSAVDGGQCFQGCQPRRSGGTKGYLACARTCPGTRVVEDQRCETVDYDSERFTCTNERDEVFSVEILAGVIIGVILFGLLAFYEIYLK